MGSVAQHMRAGVYRLGEIQPEIWKWSAFLFFILYNEN